MGKIFLEIKLILFSGNWRTVSRMVTHIDKEVVVERFVTNQLVIRVKVKVNVSSVLLQMFRKWIFKKS